MKWKFTRKTWYFMLLAMAALGMADGFGMAFGVDLSFFEAISFGGNGLAALFLAAQKAPASADGARRRAANPYSGLYFAAFLALLVSYLLFGDKMTMRLTVFWPLLAFVEQKRGMKLRQQMRLLIFSELLQAAALIAVQLGQTAFLMLAVVFWILLCIARGWAALALYRQRDPEDGTEES